MKHQQVVVDYTVMIKSCLTCLMLAFSGYILIRLVCTIFVLPKWIQKQQELDDLKLQNEAMVLKTKKFVQFLSAEKMEKSDADEDDSETLNDAQTNDDVQSNEDAQTNDDVNVDEDENSNLEEKKDK